MSAPPFPEIHYARSGDVAIAYQVVGEGPIDLVFIRGTIADLLAAWDQPRFVRHVEGLASFSRVLLFDKRGSGLSDRLRHVATLEERMDDVRAVLDAVGVDRAALFAAHEGTRLAILFAAVYPERTRALVLFDPTARGTWAPDYPWAATEEQWRSRLREVGARWGERDYLVERLRGYSPTIADDPATQEWFVWYMRRSASPAAAVAFERMQMEGDVRDVLGAVRCSTLVLHRPAGREEATYVAERIRSAEQIEIDGLRDGFSWADPERNAVIIEESRRFLVAAGSEAIPDRVLATVLFTDIVGSGAGGRARRPRLARAARAPPRRRPQGAGRLSGPRSSTRPGTGSSPRSTVRGERSRAPAPSATRCAGSAWRSAPVSTPVSASGSARSSAASRSRPARGSPLWPARGRSSSRARSRTSSPAPGSRSTTAGAVR